MIWRMATLYAVFKRGDKSAASTYRPVSPTSVCCKILEHIIYSNITSHLDEDRSIVHYQHGFRSKHSCDTQLIGAMEDIYRSIDHGQQTDLILDFSKAFDTVPHTHLCNKLHYYGIHESANRLDGDGIKGGFHGVWCAPGNCAGTTAFPTVHQRHG